MKFGKVASAPEPKTYEFYEPAFKFLMQKRIYRILIICSNYDFFMLEDDSRIDEQIFNEYVSLNLRYPPIFIHANSAQHAFRVLQEDRIDLIISMINLSGTDAFELSKEIKTDYPKIPIVVLTHFSREVSLKLENEDLSAIDYVFSWLGNPNLLLAIIKLIEDKMNLEYDIEKVGVQAVLLVEDSVRFYSSYLPNLYTILFQQTREFMTEGLNEHRSMLRMRGRPKILLATTYEEAVEFYNRYKKNLLGIISDVSYKRNGVRDTEAGFRLSRKIKADNQYLPVLLQSSSLKSGKVAKELKVGFLYKYSKTLSLELRRFVKKYFAFGDFIFEMPGEQKEIARASNLKELQKQICKIPDASLAYHIKRNHISKWLRARALFPIADLIVSLRLDQFNNLDEIRTYIYESISNYRISKSRGIIAKFKENKYDEYMRFARIGEGSLGGKARGLAFIDSFLKKRYKEFKQLKDVVITIPRTVVLTTDIFDEFMEMNDLYAIGLSSDLSDEEILCQFVRKKLPPQLEKSLLAFIAVSPNPIAIRSSSVLEDSHYQPFAGIYSTYMIPTVPNSPQRTLHLLSMAIKSVYASVFYKSSKAYMEATSNAIDEEKMAIILQEVAGTQYGDVFYPNISGVARSMNFYPIELEKTEGGIANLALGLGRIIVEGGTTLRVSPEYPEKVLQLSSPSMALRDTQNHFFALDLNPDKFSPSVDEGMNIRKLRIRDAEKHGSIKLLASSFDFQDNRIRPGVNYPGKKIITFENILKHKAFPLSKILITLLKMGQKQMSKPIEIEFAVNLDTPKGSPKIFSFLQIRPIVQTANNQNVNLDKVEENETILFSKQALGNGVIEAIHDIVYVKPETFNAAESPTIALEIEKMNKKMVGENKNYVLIGPGRWGSSDHWLGIPVKWSQISAARLIVESGLENFRIDPSQGTHFFQNLTSFRVGYFTINPYENDGFYDLDFLSKKEPVFENQYIRHIHFDEALEIQIDGQRNKGVILKPQEK